MAASRRAGFGRVLIAVYAILALAATGRSFVQILRDFDEAPLAYALSALAAAVYILATVALASRGAAWTRIALATILFELAGVIVVGTLSFTHPALFAHDSVWSHFGSGYVLIPAVLPVVGLWWLRRTERKGREVTA